MTEWVLIYQELNYSISKYCLLLEVSGLMHQLMIMDGMVLTGVSLVKLEQIVLQVVALQWVQAPSPTINRMPTHRNDKEGAEQIKKENLTGPCSCDEAASPTDYIQVLLYECDPTLSYVFSKRTLATLYWEALRGVFLGVRGT